MHAARRVCHSLIFVISNGPQMPSAAAIIAASIRADIVGRPGRRGVMSSKHAEARDDCREGRMTAALKPPLSPPYRRRRAAARPQCRVLHRRPGRNLRARQSTLPLILDQDWRARARRRQVAGHAAELSHQRPTLQLTCRDAALFDERGDQVRGEVRRGGDGEGTRWTKDYADAVICSVQTLMSGVCQFGQAGKAIAVQ